MGCAQEQTLMKSILIVEDDLQLAGSLGDYLTEQGFDVDYAYDGEMCLELTRQTAYDALVLDIAMPVMDGLSTCRHLRDVQHDSTPILFLTARDTLQDKLEGFDAGADDYLVKPFAPEEVVARLRAILQRKRRSQANTQDVGPLRLDHLSKQASRDGLQLNLHEFQFTLLATLAQAAPETVSRQELEAAIWSDEMPVSDPLRTHIYRLRQQLDKPFKHTLLHTVHGKGYRLAIPN